MFQLVACAICGGDPAVDSMLINGVISGAIATPWIFKTQLVAAIRRVRGRGSEFSIGDACQLPLAGPAQSPGDEDDASDV